MCIRDRYLLVEHEGGANVYAKESLKEVCQYEGKIRAYLQDQEVLISKESEVSIYKLKKESSKEVHEILDRDIKQEELTLSDIMAYSNIEESIAISSEGKKNNYSILCRTDLKENGEAIKNTWNIIEYKELLELDIEMSKAVSAESLNLELRFSKNCLSSEEAKRVNKAMESGEKKETVSYTHLTLPTICSV
eukprot:TRINITY_DN16534_c0_g1_i2.p1 TRINITY_DN16534_c0_g1~~TRINITY_DN16534_c0_g1_i2.p1  ORF type:complete len:192 (-),score=40.85 TRINITY_DN16534_c0_g1_i2:37-612(-)